MVHILKYFSIHVSCVSEWALPHIWLWPLRYFLYTVYAPYKGKLNLVHNFPENCVKPATIKGKGRIENVQYLPAIRGTFSTG